MYILNFHKSVIWQEKNLITVTKQKKQLYLSQLYQYFSKMYIKLKSGTHVCEFFFEILYLAV